MRTIFIAGNWKMYKTIKEAVSLASDLVNAFRDETKKIMIAPPFTALSEVYKVVKGTNILLGAQNMAQAENGAHTGEISPFMLKDAGASIVILGHSERRHIYKETDDLINRKIKLALKAGLDVIFCVGETIDEREAGNAEKVVRLQIERGLSDISSEDLSHITIAYEPVWAIGTGKTATPDDADSMHLFIRELITSMYNRDKALSMVIQYGGSVKPQNIKELMAQDNIDGALVGGASLDSDTFIPIVKFDE